MPWFLGSSDHVQSDPTEPARLVQTVNTALQSDPSQKSDKPKSPSRSVYEASGPFLQIGASLIRWTSGHPPVKSVADFLMYLLRTGSYSPAPLMVTGQPLPITGKFTLQHQQGQNLARLLDSFHRDRPKGRRGIPSWNLSLVLHQLTKAPFESVKGSSLKHLTFKTVFLLALGSGKCRSEIHAWQTGILDTNMIGQRCPCIHHPAFFPRRVQTVWPQWLYQPWPPTLDRSLKSDRSVFPVRALRYYLDRTSDLRQNKEVAFVSFKKDFDKHISPASISSWIKQTVILCYKLSDQEAHTLHQVKAHDVRAFAASKFFQSGVSLDPFLSACH